LHSTGTVLGLFRNWDGHTGECQLAAGDTLALYTDGVTEASDARGEEFGQRGLIESLRHNASLDAKATVDAVLREIQEYSAGEQADDITLIVARCQGAPKPAKKRRATKKRP
ncbi:MAG: PP2C family protein-serine/threonine phosphatase, partial [Acidobacteriaceae bacterium]